MVNPAVNGTGNDLDNTIYATRFANTLHGMEGNDTISANGGNDTLYGEDGNDSLSGDLGADVMYGGAGNDTYVVDNSGDVVDEFLGGTDNGGTDTVESSISYVLGNGLENLVLSGLQAINGTGNALNNTLTGNAQRNILDGKAGADIMAGGAGNDVYYIDNAGDTAQETAGEGDDDIIVSSVGITTSSTVGANVESVYLVGTGNLNATGDSLNNQLFGNTGANTLTGGDGNDLLMGFRNVTTARGLANPAAYGSVDGNDTLDGGAGDDTLDGGAGNDSMTGGSGSDYYIVDATGDVVVETDTLAGGAWDTVESSVDYALNTTSAAGVEGLLLTGDAVLGRGNALNNGITGTNLDNLLYGMDGDDTIYGLDGVDYIYGGNGSDFMSGDEGDDYLSGAAGNDQLEGGTGNDTLSGGGGNDTYTFYAGFGADLLDNYSSAGSTETDEIYLADASSDQLWLSRTGNDLTIAQVGTTDSVVVQNWFLGGNYQVDHIFALADGRELDAANVAGLVSTMASFSPQDMSAPGAPSALVNAKNAAWITV